MGSLPAPLLDVGLAARARPVSDRRDQVLPLAGPLRSLVVGHGLARGAVVAVEAGPDTAGGATSLGFALVAAATAAGSWCAAVGVADIGVLALHQLGVDLERLVLVPQPGARWPEATALLLQGMDAVVVSPPSQVRPAVARRLAARVRERRAVLVVLGRHAPWPEGPDLRLCLGGSRWTGAGQGHGHLSGRRLEVTVTGRRAAVRSRRVPLWLPDDTGGIDRR